MHFGLLYDSGKWNSAIWDLAQWDWTLQYGLQKIALLCSQQLKLWKKEAIIPARINAMSPNSQLQNQRTRQANTMCPTYVSTCCTITGWCCAEALTMTTCWGCAPYWGVPYPGCEGYPACHGLPNPYCCPGGSCAVVGGYSVWLWGGGYENPEIGYDPGGGYGTEPGAGYCDSYWLFGGGRV